MKATITRMVTELRTLGVFPGGLGSLRHPIASTTTVASDLGNSGDTTHLSDFIEVPKEPGIG